MSIVWASLIVAAATGVAIAAMLLVRRRAPAGSYFEDGDRAAGVFGVLATGFALLSGFVVFLAFESYDTSRSGAQAEARIVAHQFETVQFLPTPARERLSGELVCYARSVAREEWPQMTSGTLGNAPNAWGAALFRSLRATEPRSASEQAAYSKYLDERSDREDARADRTHGAEGVIPAPVWIVLFLSAGILFVFMLFFADSGERAVVQATMMGGVMILVSSLLLLLWFLDNPYHDGVGALKPVAMEGTLKLLEAETNGVGGVEAPCDRRARQPAEDAESVRPVARMATTEQGWCVGGGVGSRSHPFRVRPTAHHTIGFGPLCATASSSDSDPDEHLGRDASRPRRRQPPISPSPAGVRSDLQRGPTSRTARSRRR